MALNPKQLKFVELYLATGNATEAYVGAGYAARGHSAESCATKLLRNAEVQAAVGKAQDRATETAELTAEYVVRGLQREANYHGPGAQHAARIKAYELLGRAVKLWGDEGRDGARELGELVRGLIRGRTADRGRRDSGPAGEPGGAGGGGRAAGVEDDGPPGAR